MDNSEIITDDIPTNQPTANTMIAIVDDDTWIANAIGSWIKMLGVSADVHYSAEDLLASVDTHGEGDECPYTAAILDVNLPGMNGLELGKELRNRYPDLNIIMVTALRHEEIEALGKLPTNAHLFRKPYDLDDLERVLFNTQPA